MNHIIKRILAALIFFTRLPLWRICNIEKEYYQKVVPLWPIVGWLTGSIMCIVYSLCTCCHLPIGTAVVITLISRILTTGALHEDGFADFCDGFGGGTSRERTLEIMKDSHIGTYGVLGLIVYYLLFWNLLTFLLSIGTSPLIFIAADSVCKFISSTIIYYLPYARKEQEAKNRLIYSHTSTGERLLSAFLGLLPLLLIAFHTDSVLICLITLLAPAITATMLFRIMHRRIQGYTGDCCGATFILTELSFYLLFCLICGI